MVPFEIWDILGTLDVKVRFGASCKILWISYCGHFGQFVHIGHFGPNLAIYESLGHFVPFGMLYTLSQMGHFWSLWVTT